jgi:dextranase
MSHCTRAVCEIRKNPIETREDMKILGTVETDKARYDPGSVATICVSLNNSTSFPQSICIETRILHLGAVQNVLPCQFIDSGSNPLTFTWQTPGVDFQGYTVEVRARRADGTFLDEADSAVDVSSTWTRFPRYGFVSTYPSQPTEASIEEMRELKNFHINVVQFYDWQWKHHVPLAGSVASPTPSWLQINNITNYRQTVTDLIDAGHKFGMASMNYNLLYGAWDGYGQDGSGVDYHWGLYLSPDGTDPYGLPMPSEWAAPHIWIMDPANTAWQNYIFGREKDVFAAYPFDGWHIDNVGDKSPVYNFSGAQQTVWQDFRPFINAAKSTLNKTMVLNNVGGYGMYDTVANSTEDFLYVECWPSAGQTTYADLKSMIDNGVSWSNGKAVVLAAYMNYEYAKDPSTHPGAQFNEPGVLLTDATILASGGAHIELGDGHSMLDNEYFPNHNLVPSQQLLDHLKKYYDFDVAYENLLRGALHNNSNQITLSVRSSTDGTAGTVWVFSKDDGYTHMLNLINLTGETSNNWRDDNADHIEPIEQRNFLVTYYYGGGMVKTVNLASPDGIGSSLQTLTFQTGSDANGSFVSFRVPRLKYWDMIYFTVRGGT